MATPYASNLEGTFKSTPPDGTAARSGKSIAVWPVRYDWGLLLLRVWVFLSLFAKHGFEKLSNQGNIAFTFRDDPIHIGKFPSFLFAAFTDGICTLLIALGLGTRWAATAMFINLFVAWSLVTHFDYFKHTVASLGNHGEVIVLYMGASLVVAIAGAGRFSLDRKLGIDKFRPFRGKNST